MVGFLKISDSTKNLYWTIIVLSSILISTVFLTVYFMNDGVLSTDNQVLKFRNIDSPTRLFFNGKTGNLFNLFWAGSSGVLFFITTVLSTRFFFKVKWFIYLVSSYLFFCCVIYFYGFFNERYYSSLFLVQIIALIIFLKQKMDLFFVKMLSVFICVNMLLYSFFYFRLNISFSKTIKEQFATAGVNTKSCSVLDTLHGVILNNNMPEFYTVFNESIYSNMSTGEIYTSSGIIDLKPYKTDVNIFLDYLENKFKVKYIVSSEQMNRIDPFFKYFLLTKASLICKTNIYSLYRIN